MGVRQDDGNAMDDLNDNKPNDDETLSHKKKWKERCKINTKLVPLKLIMLLLHGGMAALYPYLTVHMRSIGLTFTEIGIIYAILPFVSSIGPPLGGALADRIGNYKIVMAGFTVLGVVTHMLLWFAVPSVLPTVTEVTESVLNLNATFPCSPGELTHIFEAQSLQGSCDASGIRWNSSQSLALFGCQSDCNGQSNTGFPRICITGPTYSDCLPWSSLNGRRLANVDLQPNNRSWTLASYHDELGHTIDKLTCLYPSTTVSQNCLVTCQVEVDMHFTVPCNSTESKGSRITTLALYMTFRFLGGIAVSTLIPIMDSAALQMADEHGGDLGFQRMFALIGMCAFPPLSGFLIGVASKGKTIVDYSPAFYIFGVMHLLGAIIACFMSLSVRIPASDIWRNMGRILKNPKVFTFIVMMFLAGCCWGFLENYLFLFMEDLGSPKWLFGMTNTVSSLSAIPVVAASTLIMRYLGHTKILMMCFVLYGCRFLAYSFIYNAYHILPVEILEAFTTSLLWVVASVYCGKIAPDYLATLQGVIGSMHYAMGRGAGSLIGGLMFDYFKARRTYLIFGSTSIAIGVVYAILHYSWLRRIPNPEKEEPKTEEELMAHPPLTMRHHLSKKEEQDVVRIAQFEALTKTLSSLSASGASGHAR